MITKFYTYVTGISAENITKNRFKKTGHLIMFVLTFPVWFPLLFVRVPVSQNLYAFYIFRFVVPLGGGTIGFYPAFKVYQYLWGQPQYWFDWWWVYIIGANTVLTLLAILIYYLLKK